VPFANTCFNPFEMSYDNSPTGQRLRHLRLTRMDDCRNVSAGNRATNKNR
jgi:hypothetical protein